MLTIVVAPLIEGSVLAVHPPWPAPWAWQPDLADLWTNRLRGWQGRGCRPAWARGQGKRWVSVAGYQLLPAAFTPRACRAHHHLLPWTCHLAHVNQEPIVPALAAACAPLTAPGGAHPVTRVTLVETAVCALARPPHRFVLLLDTLESGVHKPW